MSDDDIWEEEAYEDENYVMPMLKFDRESLTLMGYAENAIGGESATPIVLSQEAAVG